MVWKMKLSRDRMTGLGQTNLGIIFRNVGHFAVFAIRRFYSERMNNAAASLTYSTLLAIVPLLVIAFAILSSFPAFDAVKERMQALFFDAVVPEAGAAVTDYLSNFTRNASNLTAVGVIALAVTALLLLSTIEDTLNRIWHVERSRPILVRFLIFWAILTLGPLLIGASFTLTSDLVSFASRTAIPGFSSSGGLMKLQDSWLFSSLLSIAINIFGFTALFVLVPARRVSIWHAAIGASFAAVAFEILSWGFNSFLTSGSSYETIYGAVAAVPVFLIWIYTSWMVIILGAVIAATIPDWWMARNAVLNVNLGPADRLVIAIALLAKLHRNAQSGGTIGEADLAETAPLEARDEIFDMLHAAGYLVQTEDGSVALARDLHTTTALDLAGDMELSLGIGPDRTSNLPKEIKERLALETVAVYELLARLFDAESEILDRPLAQIIAGPETADGVVNVEKIAYKTPA
jgi:membrane protein